jgi:hypothetical protein
MMGDPHPGVESGGGERSGGATFAVVNLSSRAQVRLH